MYILPRKLSSYIFAFQLLPFAFSLILRDPFMEMADFFPKSNFHKGSNFVGKICREIAMGKLMIRSY